MDKIELMCSPLQMQRVKDRVLKRLSIVLDHGQFINGPEVEAFELDIANYLETKNAIACANGTDALTVALMALELKVGEVVFTPSFTFVATAESIRLIGGIPWFVDVNEENYNISVPDLDLAIKH